MFYKKELDFLCNVFERSHVHTAVIPKSELCETLESLSFELPSDISKRVKGLSEQTLGELSRQTVYKLSAPFGLCYMYLALPSPSASPVFLVGPYLSAAIASEQIPEIGERNGIPPKYMRYLEEYLMGIPVLSQGNHLFTMLESFCELIWQSPSFAIVDVNGNEKTAAPTGSESQYDDGLYGVAVNMKAMEARYAFENEMIRAVSLGQLHMERQLLAAFSEECFEKRTADPLRNAKNYGVIMNTLLRKAAETGGVHPIYLDRLSSEFAVKIEQMPSLSDNTPLMSEMFRAYCRLVRKHSVNQYSPLVQKAVLLVDSAISSDLSLRILAEELGVSSGYLSTVFKRETGRTVSEYIRNKRMEHAKHLLSTTNLQIQTVALHCGILDVQYFSKIFKKQTGKTPKEYREATK